MALELALALIASMAFGRLFNVRHRELLVGGFAGMCSWWGLRIVMGMATGIVPATLVGALAVGAVGELAARWFRAPVTIFIVPGIVPLVPGAVAYAAMLAFLKGDLATGMAKALESLFSAGAIAIGLIITGSLARVIAVGMSERK